MEGGASRVHLTRSRSRTCAGCHLTDRGEKETRKWRHMGGTCAGCDLAVVVPMTIEHADGVVVLVKTDHEVGILVLLGAVPAATLRRQARVDDGWCGWVGVGALVPLGAVPWFFVAPGMWEGAGWGVWVGGWCAIGTCDVEDSWGAGTFRNVGGEGV